MCVVCMLGAPINHFSMPDCQHGPMSSFPICDPSLSNPQLLLISSANETTTVVRGSQCGTAILDYRGAVVMGQSGNRLRWIYPLSVNRINPWTGAEGAPLLVRALPSCLT